MLASALKGCPFTTPSASSPGQCLFSVHDLQTSGPCAPIHQTNGRGLPHTHVRRHAPARSGRLGCSWRPKEASDEEMAGAKTGEPMPCHERLGGFAGFGGELEPST